MSFQEPSTHSASEVQGGISYSSRLLSALNKFTGGLATEVHNPMALKYGRAYEYLIAADACRYREDLETAMVQYKQALALREDLTEARIGIGKCLRRKGDSMGAIRYFKQALEANPFNKEVHLDIAKSYNECGYLEQAIRHFERALKLDPAYIEARFGLALIVELNQDMNYATRLYQEIIDQDPGFLPAYNNLGSIYLRLGLYAPAEKVFRDLVEKAPDFSRGYLGLALTLDKAGKKRDALATYRQVLTLKAGSRNAEYVEKRIIALSRDLGMTKTRRNVTLVRIK